MNYNFDGSEIHETDDWGIIEDPNTEIKIKAITVYASHYIMAIEVTYIEADLRETKVVHASNNKYLRERPDIEKSTLVLESDEFIDFISYTFSSQKRYIRSIQIGTTAGHLMVLEGQIELNNLTTESNQTSSYSSLLQPVVPEQETEKKSAVTNEESLNQMIEFNVDQRRGKASNSHNIVKVPDYNKFNAKETHQLSVLKQNEKVKTVDLVKYKQRLVGLKTRFSEYLLGIDLYTEP